MMRWALVALCLLATSASASDFNKGLVVGKVIATTPTCSANPCVVGSVLTAPAGMTGPFQWYNNINPIGGANGNTYTPSATGNYKVSGLLNGVTVTTAPVALGLNFSKASNSQYISSVF